MKLDTYIMTYTKNNSKWIKDLNVRPSTIKLLEENRAQKLNDVRFGNDFWICHQTQRKQKKKWTIWTYKNIEKCKKFASKDKINSKKAIHRMRKYLQMLYLIKVYYSKYVEIS